MKEQIERTFKVYVPTEKQIALNIMLCNKAKELAVLIDEACFPSREKSAAITNLELALYWANAAITRHGVVGLIKGKDVVRLDKEKDV